MELETETDGGLFLPAFDGLYGQRRRTIILVTGATMCRRLNLNVYCSSVFEVQMFTLMRLSQF